MSGHWDWVRRAAVVAVLALVAGATAGCRAHRPEGGRSRPCVCGGWEETGAATVRVVPLKHEPAGAAMETLHVLMKSDGCAGMRGRVAVAANEPANAVVLQGPEALVEGLSDMLIDLDKAAAEHREMMSVREREERERAEVRGRMRPEFERPLPPGPPGGPMRPEMGPGGFSPRPSEMGPPPGAPGGMMKPGAAPREGEMKKPQSKEVKKPTDKSKKIEEDEDKDSD